MEETILPLVLDLDSYHFVWINNLVIVVIVVFGFVGLCFSGCCFWAFVFDGGGGEKGFPAEKQVLTETVVVKREDEWV